MNPPRHRRRPRAERGSIAIEIAILAPSLLLLIALIYAYGRVQNVNGLLDSGTRAGARSATQENSLAGAQATAQQVVSQSVAGVPSECAGDLSVNIVQNGFGPGEPITVVATCSYPLSWALPGFPGTVQARSEFTSPLDINREYD